MSEQYPGGFISKEPPTPQGNLATSSAYGIWNLSQQAAYQAQGLWPDPANVLDAQFNYVTMLLHGDGTNGAQNNTFLDSSTNNFTITRNGNTTQGSFSPYGSNWSNYFNGNGDFLSTPNSTPLDLGSGSFTIEAWIYSAGTNSNVSAAIISKYSSTNTDWMLRLTRTGSTYDGIEFDGGGSGWSASYAFSFNTWYHVAVVRNGTSLRFYVNGVDVGGATVSFTLASSAEPVRIGEINYSGYYYYWNGYISNARIVKGTAVYTGNFTPSTTPLTAISGTSLLTCQSNRFIDNSTNAATITPNGTPSVQRFNPFGTSTAYSTATIGGSGYFDGSGDYLSIPNASGNLGTGDFAISFWMYASADPTNAVIATNAYNQTTFTGGWAFQAADPSTLYFYCGSASGGIGGATKLLTGQWNYIEASRSGTTIRVFVNGVQLNSATNSSTGTSANATIVGARRDGTAAYFPGYITDFKIVIGTAGNTTTYTPPTAPVSSTSSSLLLSMQNAAIYDNAMMNDLETVGNAQISTSVKKYGTGSMSFPTTGDYLTTLATSNLSFGTGDFTVEGWMYFNTVGSDMTLFTGTTNGNISIRIVSSQIRVGTLGVSWDTSSATQSFSTATWYHFAVVRSSGTITFYLNGTSIGSGANTNSYNVSAGATIAQTGGGAHLDGYIDDLRITKGYARYTTTFTPPTQAFPNIGP